ncbi:MAG: glucose-6-phosphate isomerase, partial [Acinetobacter faecalis]
MVGKIHPYPVESLDSVIQNLQALKTEFEKKHLTELFAEETTRFQNFSVSLSPIVFDFSKHRINQNVLKGLAAWANAQDLTPWIKRLFSTEQINYTENRAAMHWALRLPKNDQVHPELAS